MRNFKKNVKNCERYKLKTMLSHVGVIVVEVLKDSFHLHMHVFIVLAKLFKFEMNVIASNCSKHS